MANRFTQEQLNALTATGKTIVSASAGSGKTTVMIEKIIRLIKDGCSVKEILAVTFTKKASSQMKEKLSKALITAINDSETPKGRRLELKKQLSEVASADISTIHSFCARLIRANFYSAGVDNAFRVINGDDAEGVALKNEALTELFDEAYEEQNADFMLLLDVYWRKKSDNTLRKILLSTYENLRNRADYREYLQNTSKCGEDTFRSVCGDLHAMLQEKCAYYLKMVEKEKDYFESVGAKAQLALSHELIQTLTAVLNTENYFDACLLQKPKYTANRTSKKDAEETLVRANKLGELKKKIVKIYDEELNDTLSYEEELANFLSANEIAVALSKYLLRFDELYTKLKTERSVLDYADLEHKALALLKIPEIAEETQKKYRYVFVDEYQDVNPVQEEIVSLVANKNLFLVGDVKQSIYGFRGSKSKFFVEKQKQFQFGDGNNLFMKRNFRSSDKVLDAVNKQFSLAMTTENCEVDYAVDSYMERGGRYAVNDGRVQLHFIAEDEETDKATARGVYSVRAHANRRGEDESAIAKTIRYIIEQEKNAKWYDADSGEYKRVQYSDIAILSRKKQGQIAKTVTALSAEGIPVTASSAVNICEYAEIKTLIDILSLLDNAEQDIPLCSALLSPMGDLTADELVEIRLAYKKEKFFRTACRRYAEEIKTGVTKHKLLRFFERYDAFRNLSFVLDAGELMIKLVSDFRMEARLLSRDNGVSCLKRIHRFIEEAYNGEPLCVHEFLKRLRDLDYKIEYSENGGEDSVHVLTMHASKGLEYPIVILDNLNAPFRGVVDEEVFVQEQYALAPRAFSREKMLKKETLLRRLHKNLELKSTRQDELNLYYVALTRAKYGLHMLFKEKTAFPDVRYAKSFADFTDFSVWEDYEVKDDIFDIPRQERTALAFRPDEELAGEIMKAFLWKYTHTGYENLPVKSSATALLSGGAYAMEQETAYTPITDEKEDYTGAGTSKEAGIAYHAFLENFDFGKLYDESCTPVDKETLRTLVQETYDNQKEIGEIDCSLLTVEKLTEILSNPAFYTLKDKVLYKERQFLVSLPVRDTHAKTDTWQGKFEREDDREEMLFQGAIDLLAVGENEVHIIDYKYSVRDKESIKKHYAPQLDLYRQATAKILGVDKSRVHCSIINIYRGYQVDID